MDRVVAAIIAVTILSILLAIRILVVWREIHLNRQRGYCDSGNKQRTRAKVPTLIVLGSGGHTTEMLLMTKHLSSAHYHPIHYIKAATDTTSLDRLRTAHPDKRDTIIIHDIPRSREVGQSYASSILSTIHAFGFAFLLVVRLRPRLLLCNGPGTCVPICLSVWILRVLLGNCCHVVFCESYCRVETLSLTGKLLYHGGLADLFVVHWKELREKYPDTVLTTSFVVDHQ